MLKLGKAIFQAGLVLIVLVAAKVAAAAEAPPPTSQEWAGFLTNIRLGGDKYESDETNYTAYALGRGTSFDRGQERTVEYLALTGQTDELGRFQAKALSRVQETWTGGGNVWHVEQKITSISLGGEVTGVLLQKITITGGMVTAMDSATGDAAAEAASWAGDVRSWMALAEDKAGVVHGILAERDRAIRQVGTPHFVANGLTH